MTVFLVHPETGGKLAIVSAALLCAALLVYYVFAKINIDAQRETELAAAGESERRIIELDIELRHEQLFILMKNSIDGSVLKANPTLATTKADGEYHGLGIRNMRRIAEAHGGSISFYEEDGFFCCDILM